MDRARGINVIAGVLIVVLIAEVIGAVIGQQQVWIFGDALVPRMFRSPFVPGVIAATAIVFAIEGLIRRRDEKSMFGRVVAMLIVAVGLPIAALVGAVTGVISQKYVGMG